jgi:hypothetical protein
LAHIEVQTQRDPALPRRLFDYHYHIERRHRCRVRIPMKADTCSDSYRTLIRRYRTVVGAKRRSEVSNKELSDMRQENRT